MHVLAGALLLAFPDSTVRDTARFIMKASATGGSLTSAGTCKERSLTQADVKGCGSIGAGEAPASDHLFAQEAGDALLTEGQMHSRCRYSSCAILRQKGMHRSADNIKCQAGYRPLPWLFNNMCGGEEQTHHLRHEGCQGKRMLPLLRKHLDDARACNVHTGTLLLDREFYSHDVITFLRNRNIPFIMPVRTGRKMAACWNRGMHSFTTVHTLKSGVDSIDLKVQVAKRRENGRIRSYCFAVHRMCTSPKQTMQLYRRRFGIETSYRIAEMARPGT